MLDDLQNKYLVGVVVVVMWPNQSSDKKCEYPEKRDICSPEMLSGQSVVAWEHVKEKQVCTADKY